MAVIGLDLGGTKLSGGLFSESGELLFKDSCKLEKRTGDDAGLLIQDFVKRLINQANSLKITIYAAGICIPGISYHETGCVWAPNIEGWENYPVRAKIQEVVNKDVKVIVDSDRACAIFGESWLGAAKGCKNAIFLTVGTGIGAGIIVNNQLVRGAHDIAGAIGWWALDTPFQDKFAPCGCFEYHASGEGIAKVAREIIQNDKTYDGILRSKAINEITAHDIFYAYGIGDNVAKRTLSTAITFWGMAVANLVSIFDPEKIIFGGGVFGPASMFIDDIYKEAKKHAQPISIEKVKMEISQLGSEAMLIGAGYIALKAIKNINDAQEE
ncbi:MAG: ROK family protein [Prevotellaceae bacterium]|jgi:glucokinase|nr:ROK family protein [Prevotellaceae bacterium]